MKLPVRIFSDLHLGHKASRIDEVESLRPLFRGVGTVVFNGDTWEELSGAWRENSQTMLKQLHKTLAEEQCETIFLSGNHDPGWEGKGWLELAEGRILITHGDALLRDGAPWKREMLRGTGIVDALWNEFPDAESDPFARHELARKIAREMPTRRHPDGKSLIARVFDAVFPPRRAIAMILAWIGQAKFAAEFCDRYFPAAQVIVNGHFHCAGTRTVGNRLVLNTGSFVVPGPAKWVQWDGEILTTGTIRKCASSYKINGAESSWKLF